MELAYTLFTLALVINLAAGLVRVLRGPRVADRLLAAQLLGTVGVALLLALAAAWSWPALRDVALVFALLGLLAALAWARLTPGVRADLRRGDGVDPAAGHD
jgi:multicomponent Na+:H+ antiporter subunit F